MALFQGRVKVLARPRNGSSVSNRKHVREAPLFLSSRFSVVRDHLAPRRIVAALPDHGLARAGVRTAAHCGLAIYHGANPALRSRPAPSQQAHAARSSSNLLPSGRPACLSNRERYLAEPTTRKSRSCMVHSACPRCTARVYLSLLSPPILPRLSTPCISTACRHFVERAAPEHVERTGATLSFGL